MKRKKISPQGSHGLLPSAGIMMHMSYSEFSQPFWQYRTTPNAGSQHLHQIRGTYDIFQLQTTDVLVFFTGIVKDFLTEAKQHVQINPFCWDLLFWVKKQKQSNLARAGVSNENIQTRKQDPKDYKQKSLMVKCCEVILVKQTSLIVLHNAWIW